MNRLLIGSITAFYLTMVLGCGGSSDDEGDPTPPIDLDLTLYECSKGLDTTDGNAYVYVYNVDIGGVLTDQVTEYYTVADFIDFEGTMYSRTVKTVDYATLDENDYTMDNYFLFDVDSNLYVEHAWVFDDYDVRFSPGRTVNLGLKPGESFTTTYEETRNYDSGADPKVYSVTSSQTFTEIKDYTFGPHTITGCFVTHVITKVDEDGKETSATLDVVYDINSGWQFLVQANGNLTHEPLSLTVNGSAIPFEPAPVP